MVVTKWISRVTLAFTYEADHANALQIHQDINEVVTNGARDIHDQLAAAVHSVNVDIARAAGPQVLTTENAPAAPGGTEQTEAFTVEQMRKMPGGH